MKLLEVIQELDTFDNQGTIYAAKPWTENPEAMVMQESESGAPPSEAEKLGLKYFLEISIAHDFIQDWMASLDVEPSSLQKCLRLIQYAVNDA